MKATEQYFSVALFIMLYKAVLTFESVNRPLNPLKISFHTSSPTCCLSASVSCMSEALSVNTARYFSNPSSKAVHTRSFFTSITEAIFGQKLSSSL